MLSLFTNLRRPSTLASNLASFSIGCNNLGLTIATPIGLVKVLNDISLTIKPGQIIAAMGYALFNSKF